jgi:PAS domain S-box-containing protein
MLLLMMSDPPPIRSIPSHEILEGLSRLHPFVLLTDARGRIQWMSAQLRKRLCEDPRVAGLAAGGDKHLVEQVMVSLPKRPQLEALRSRLLASGRAGRVSIDVELGNGEPISVDASAFAVDSESGGEPHYVVIARPHSEQERNDNDTSTSARLLSQILDNSPHGVIATDASGHIIYANPLASSFLGSPKLVGEPVAAFLPKSRSLEDLLVKLRDPAGWDGEEIETFDMQGRSSWVSVSTRPLRDENGETAGVITYLRDITQRHEVQEELEGRNGDLETYADSVAHDLRSPLVSLLGFTRLLREDYAASLDEPGRRFLERVEQAGQTMDALIHDLLELSRIRRSESAIGLLDPRSVLRQVEAELKLRLEGAGVQLELPEDPPLVRADATRLYQMFSNLVGNALTHGFDGAEPFDKRVKVEVKDNGDETEIIVSDNGRGVAVEDQQRIFDAFQTGRGVRRDEKSHGIGLAIVKKICQAHGGRTWVESEPGDGARFHVVLPAA